MKFKENKQKHTESETEQKRIPNAEQTNPKHVFIFTTI